MIVPPSATVSKLIALCLLLNSSKLVMGLGKYSDSPFNINIGKLLDTFDSTVKNIFGVDGDTTDSNCMYYKCPKGKLLKPKVGYRPTSNGCGSFGIEINLSDMPLLEKCCNVHDFCYEECGQNRTLCDVQLQECAHGVCMDVSKKHGGQFVPEASLKACTTLSEMMFQTTNLLGCSPFKKAQRAACKCESDHNKNDDKDEL